MSSVNDPNDLLRNLVSSFEENEKELTDVPEKAVKYFGYSCLANALMFKKPKIPNYDRDNIFIYIWMNNFPTIDNLCDFIKSLKEDINKLFAIFCWESLNISYDVDSYFSGNHQSATLEKVFETKLALCDGYALFFNEMAKRVNINTNRIKIKNYSNYAKGYSYDPLNPPKSAKSNQASIYIEIDGVPFICDPTWGAGGADEEKKFCSEFRLDYFLIPIYDTLSDHYPCDESLKLLPINLPYEDYLKSIIIWPNSRNIKTESNPFVRTKCKNGYLEQIYSCDGNFDSVNFKMSIQKNNNFEQIPEEGLIGYEVLKEELPKHPERCRFQVNIAFPHEGLFNIKMYINRQYILEYYVDSLCKSSKSIPIDYNPFRNEKFIAILPKTVLTEVESNHVLIKFAIAKEKAHFLYQIHKLNNSNYFNSNAELIDQVKYSEDTYGTPFDEERYEYQIYVNLPSEGRYSVKVFLKNDKSSFKRFVTYYFDVKGETEKEDEEPIDIVTKKKREWAFEETRNLDPTFFQKTPRKQIRKDNQNHSLSQISGYNRNHQTSFLSSSSAISPHRQNQSRNAQQQQSQRCHTQNRQQHNSYTKQ